MFAENISADVTFPWPDQWKTSPKLLGKLFPIQESLQRQSHLEVTLENLSVKGPHSTALSLCQACCFLLDLGFPHPILFTEED